jgi:hypothetical protein
MKKNTTPTKMKTCLGCSYMSKCCFANYNPEDGTSKPNFCPRIDPPPPANDKFKYISDTKYAFLEFGYAN